MTKQTHTFQATESLSMENSFAVLKQQEDITLNVTVGINSPDYGWFELYDEQTEGDEWHAEGGLWFEGKQVTGYDGVFALPVCVVEKLKELGYDTQEVE
jgi:hypothetical protein